VGMQKVISKRFEFLRGLSKHLLFRIAMAIWAGSGIWDLALSEWIPEETAKHLPKVYQVVAMTLGIISWQLWIMAGVIIAALSAIEYAYRLSNSHNKREIAPHKITGELNINLANNTVDNQIPSADSEPAKYIDCWPSPASKQIVATNMRTHGLDGLEKLYEVYKPDVSKNATKLRLLFLPDTDDCQTDSLLVICFLYKTITGADRMSRHFVDTQVMYLLQHAPNTPLVRKHPIMQSFLQLHLIAAGTDNIGSAAVGAGLVELVNLASGGSYRLTPSGEEHAKAVAQRMIQQA
jgi:hypothetical protein